MRSDTTTYSAADTSGEIVEIAPGAVYRLGGRAPRDGRVSWAGADAGWEPISCYLLVDGDRALLIDTGVAAHQALVLEQLATLVPERCRLSLFLTRAELDCIGNLAAIASRFRLDGVFTGGVVNPFDAFDHVTSLVPQGVPFARGADTSRLSVGSGRELTVLRPKLRLLATFWAYDDRSRTLFTSDAFGHAAVEDEAAGAVVDGAPRPIDREAVESTLAAKFEWLTQCPGVADVADGVREVFARHEVHAIAPSHGCVIRGEAAVRDHVAAVVDVLERYADA